MSTELKNMTPLDFGESEDFAPLVWWDGRLFLATKNSVSGSTLPYEFEDFKILCQENADGVSYCRGLVDNHDEKLVTLDNYHFDYWMPRVDSNELLLFQVRDRVTNLEASSGGSVDLAPLTSRVVSLEDGVSGLSTRVTDLEASSGGSGVLPGTVLMWGLSSAPEGWAVCDGSAIQRSTPLGQLLVSDGCPHGEGDGTTTVNLPDFCGRVPLGAGAGDGLTARTIGEKGGEEVHTLTVAEMPNHNHTVLLAANNVAINYSQLALQNCNNTNTRGTSSVGGGQPHNNLPPYSGINFIIKLKR